MDVSNGRGLEQSREDGLAVLALAKPPRVPVLSQLALRPVAPRPAKDAQSSVL